MSTFPNKYDWFVRPLIILPALAIFEASSPKPATAQFSVLHHFSRALDGEDPFSITKSGSIIFGTAGRGANNRGIIWSFNTTAGSLAKLYDFDLADGSGPRGGVVFSNGRVLGTANAGGNTNSGTIWTLDISTGNFAKLHDFLPSGSSIPVNEGSQPRGALALDDGLLFGVNFSAELGTLWQFDTSARLLTVLHHFTGGTDGRHPAGGVTASGNLLYGTSNTAIWSYDRSASKFNVLYNFVPGTETGGSLGNLIVDGNVLYGTSSGGITGLGSIWSFDTATGTFTKLHQFTGTTDGRQPQGTIAFDGTSLYGTANQTIWSLNTESGLFKTLHALNLQTDGNKPEGGLILDGHTLYGTSLVGGAFGDGTLWAFVIPEPSTLVLVLLTAFGVYGWRPAIARPRRKCG